jgi:two-component system nitrogen regulation response regulator GlnG
MARRPPYVQLLHGPIGELQPTAERAKVPAAGPVLLTDCLLEPSPITSAPREPASPVLAQGSSDLASLVAGLLDRREFDIYRKILLEVDRIVLVAVLRHVQGNQVQASELLGISRTTLRAKLRALHRSAGKPLHSKLDPRLCDA